MKNILFICTGNTCRSPMAEGFLRAGLKEDRDLSERFTVSSAGISVYPGDGASPNSIDVLRSEWNIDISNHIASPVNKDDIADAFLILTMTRQQKKAIEAMYPEARGKIHTLKEFACEKTADPDYEQYDYTLDIMDPYGMPPGVYGVCAREIKAAIEKLASILKNF